MLQEGQGEGSGVRTHLPSLKASMASSVRNFKISKFNFNHRHPPKIILGLEQQGITNAEDQARVLLRDIKEPSKLHGFKWLLRNPEIQTFPHDLLVNALGALTDSDELIKASLYSMDTGSTLELHLRTLVAVLESISFSSFGISRALIDRVDYTLRNLAEVYKPTTNDEAYRPVDIYNNSDSNFEMDYYVEAVTVRSANRNRNIDFLAAHLRSTLNILETETATVQDVQLRITNSLRSLLAIGQGPAFIKPNSPITNSPPWMDVNSRRFASQPQSPPQYKNLYSNSPPSFNWEQSPPSGSPPFAEWEQRRPSTQFKQEVYGDRRSFGETEWHILLIIRQRLSEWASSGTKILPKAFAERAFLEHLWLLADKEKIKFSSNYNRSDFLLFGILDLAQELAYSTSEPSTLAICYHFSVNLLASAPTASIRFKAIELLFVLKQSQSEVKFPIDEQLNWFSNLIDKAFGAEEAFSYAKLCEYVRAKNENDIALFSKFFQATETKETPTLITGKGKARSISNASSFNSINTTNLDSNDPIDLVIRGMTCAIDHEPTPGLWCLECGHVISRTNFYRLQQLTCPLCRLPIKSEKCVYIPQDTIYRNLYPQFVEIGIVNSPAEENPPSPDNSGDENGNENVNEDQPPLVNTENEEKKPAPGAKRSFSIGLFSKSFTGRTASKSSLTRKPTVVEAKGRKAIESGDYSGAVECFTKILEATPEDYAARCNRSSAYNALGEIEKALEDLGVAISLEMDTFQALLQRSEIYYALGEHTKALSDINKAQETNADNTFAHVIKGNVYLGLGNDENAMFSFMRALKVGNKTKTLFENSRKFRKSQNITRVQLELNMIIFLRRNDLASPSGTPQIARTLNIVPQSFVAYTIREAIHAALDKTDGKLYYFFSTLKRVLDDHVGVAGGKKFFRKLQFELAVCYSYLHKKIRGSSEKFDLSMIVEGFASANEKSEKSKAQIRRYLDLGSYQMSVPFECRISGVSLVWELHDTPHSVYGKTAELSFVVSDDHEFEIHGVLPGIAPGKYNVFWRFRVGPNFKISMATFKTDVVWEASDVTDKRLDSTAYTHTLTTEDDAVLKEQGWVEYELPYEIVIESPKRHRSICNPYVRFAIIDRSFLAHKGLLELDYVRLHPVNIKESRSRNPLPSGGGYFHCKNSCIKTE